MSTAFGEDIFPIHSTSTLEPIEYVRMMGDVLRMKKNLCICRNFHKLNKDKKR